MTPKRRETNEISLLITSTFAVESCKPNEVYLTNKVSSHTVDFYDVEMENQTTTTKTTIIAILSS